MESSKRLQVRAQDHSLTRYMYELERALAKFSAGTLEQYPVSRQDIRLLVLIESNPDVPQSRIAEAMGLERSSLVPIIDRLEHEGYLSRHHNPSDGRSKILRLTAKGTRQANVITKQAADAEDSILHGFSVEERQQLLDLLGKACRNLHRLGSD